MDPAVLIVFHDQLINSTENLNQVFLIGKNDQTPGDVPYKFYERCGLKFE